MSDFTPGVRKDEKREHLLPPEWDADGKLVWPPRSTKRLYATTYTHWAMLLNALADADEVDKSGYATRNLAKRAGLPPMSNSTYTGLCLDLEFMGLIEREIGPRKCYAIRLAIPASQLPDEVVGPNRLRFDTEEAEKPTPEAELVEPEEPVLDAPPGTVTGVFEDAPVVRHPASDYDYKQLADEIVNEVVRRANEPHADPEELARLNLEVEFQRERAERLAEDLRTRKRNVDTLVQRNKDLTHERDELERKVKQLERNLAAAISAAQDLAEQAPTVAREATRKGLERLMQNRDR